MKVKGDADDTPLDGIGFPIGSELSAAAAARSGTVIDWD